MRFALDVPNLGDFADVRAIAEVAAAADAGGWDGFFIWDHIVPTFIPGGLPPVADTTVALTAIALATSRVRFGALVTPLPRRRPQKLARELASLDVLSGGRLVLGVGIGFPPEEYTLFGEDGDARHRGDALDESLDAITQLWAGEPVSLSGRHVHVETPPGAAFLPRPVQQPRIPIWVAAMVPGNTRPLRRAARWDGVVPMGPDGMRYVTSEEIDAMRTTIGRDDGFDVVVTPPPDSDLAAYEAAGATWCIDVAVTFRDAIARARAGPPRRRNRG
jgi:alkanesulfonate monooxygenase SsuD/methylene tetrahydromethanopterin reductase-like flavin-dependent oxidoreductase (luciferase family)